MIFQRRKTAAFKTTFLLHKACSILILLLASSVGPSESVESGQECGGPLSYTPFVCIEESIAYFDRCAFPTPKLNPDCMLSCCPRLNGLSPLDGEGNVDPTVVAGIVEVLNDCLTNTPTICGINVASTPMVQQGWTLDQLIPAFLAVNGTCILSTKGGSVDNLNQAVISLSPQQNPSGASVTLSVSAPKITQFSSWNCTMSVPKTFLNPLLPGLIELLNFPDTACVVNITVNPTISIDLSAVPPTVKVLSDDGSIGSRMSNFVGCGISLPQVLVSPIDTSVDQFFKASQTNNYAIGFYAAFASSGFAAAMQSCR